MRRLRLASMPAIALVALLTVPTSAIADSSASEIDTQDSDTQIVNSQSQIENLTVQVDLRTASSDAEIRVDDLGTITVDQEGSRMVVSQDGSWEILDSSDEANGEVQPLWNVSLCTGYFASMYVNAEDALQWGAQQVCSDYDTWPHKVDVQLRQGGTGFLDSQILKYSVPGRMTYSRIANNIMVTSCKNHVDHRTRTRAHPFANEVSFPWVTSDEIIVACNTA